MKLIRSTKNGEIMIFENYDGERIAICKLVLGFELCEKFAKKYNARIPHGQEMSKWVDILNYNQREYKPYPLNYDAKKFTLKNNGL